MLEKALMFVAYNVLRQIIATWRHWYNRSLSVARKKGLGSTMTIGCATSVENSVWKALRLSGPIGVEKS